MLVRIVLVGVVLVGVVLVRVGVPEDKVELKKPEVTTGSGDNAQARRVEVLLIDCASQPPSLQKEPGAPPGFFASAARSWHAPTGGGLARYPFP